MSVLQAMLAELSTESVQTAPELNVDALLDYGIESVSADLSHALTLCIELDAAHSAYSSESIDLPSFESQVATAFLRAGLDLPAVLIVPSFEADSAAAKAEQQTAVTEKKDGVVKRTIEWIKNLIQKLTAWLKEKFGKKTEQLKEAQSKVVKPADLPVDNPKKLDIEIPSEVQLNKVEECTALIKNMLAKSTFTETDVTEVDKFLKDLRSTKVLDYIEPQEMTAKDFKAKIDNRWYKTEQSEANYKSLNKRLHEAEVKANVYTEAESTPGLVALKTEVTVLKTLSDIHYWVNHFYLKLSLNHSATRFSF